MSDENPAPPAPSARRRRGAALVAAVGAIGAGLFLWTGGVPQGRGFGPAPAGYYALQTAGFRSGRLYAAMTPHPGLLALRDPYDPAANGPYRALDAAYWKGRYYLYQGVSPVLILFWPVAAVSGRYPTDACAAGLFCAGCYLAAVVLLAGVRRRHFPDAPGWPVAAGAACLAFASPLLLLAVRAGVYEVPIACAAFLETLLFGAAAAALRSERRPAAWLAAASLCFGLAVGARPDYLPGGLALAIPWLWLARRRGAKARLLLGLAAFGPAAACGAGLAWYNWERFGSVLEFGWHYQLSGASQLHARPFALGHVGPHALTYLFAGASWQRYFPFLTSPGDSGWGLLRYLPWCWLAGAAFLPPSGDPARGKGLLPLVSFIAASTAANFLFLSSFFATTDRYRGDFEPGIFVLAAMGALSVVSRFSKRNESAPGRPRTGRPVGAAVAGAAAWSALAGLAALAAAYPRPGRLVPLARLCDRPAAWWERATGRRLGGLRLELRLPSGREGATEPLFETGAAHDRRDWLQITYLAGGCARLGFYHAGLGLVSGRAFPIPADRGVVIEGRCGSLYPPYAHPVFASWSRADYEAARRDVRFEVDGREALRAELDCYPSPPGALRIGRRGWPGDGVADRFSGRVLAWRRLPLGSEEPPAPVFHRRAPLEMTVLFPADRPFGREPLVAAGEGASADLIYCIYDGPGRVRFAFDHADSGGPEGAPMNYVPTRPYRLELALGSLAPLPAGGPWSRRVVVVMDGAQALNQRATFGPASPESVRLGLSPFPSTVVARRFGGRVLAAKQAAGFGGLPRPGPSGDFGAVDMRVVFPRAFGSTEPLVVTGATGAGDILYIRYEDSTHVRIGFDHWGTGGVVGPLVKVDYGRPHRLEIALGSLFPPGTAGARSGRVRVRLDGTAALDGPADCYPSDPSEIAIGGNPIGGSTCGPAFTGRILAVARPAEPGG